MAVILFDGVCNFCNSTINYIIDHDEGRHRFASLQSEFGQELLKKNKRSITNFDSVILWEDGCLYEKSEAALRIAKHVKGWKWLWAFRFLPLFLRNGVYNLIARNRYTWFGKREACRLPSLEERARFVG
ncbi:thiol-disulfide oxidoreductase DCC family protein [Siphonobacter sp. SORGH_AS_0500]|uniref:thiol-disulfide oxidoreductase DCC family protein n=1 Tax=Siphonobacter sp. SORGH_AS_0500 TaxID=1864824 RepID=UPI000CB2E74F|nr:DCC1-like thiol-disulfide oxidoreductase family protein [Siphonobacter sp. SORGH_AS_0500]MDR6196133.1 putative DCC family thiol-disulfide oxidoreductase YuxK [Siphonobacter sp. SORGH_AS_0500]PKK34626.1 hypothetical protein BWI96_21300 [Siphonobacter sp. SORGH_AS_0500]